MYCISHIALSVTNLKKSLEFYEKFGFVISKSWKAADNSLEIAHLKLDETLLELFCYKTFSPLPNFSHELSTDLPVIGTKHFALGVESIDKARDDLSKKGIIAPDINITKGRLGKRYFFITDPDGILIEIIEM